LGVGITEYQIYDERTDEIMAFNKTTKKETNWFDGVELNDTYLITGLVKKELFKNDKVSKFNVEIARHTPNDKIARAWITVIDFDGLLKEGKVYDMSCNIVSNKYDDKKGNTRWSTDFVVNEVNEL